MEEQYPRAYAEVTYLLKKLTEPEYKKISPKVIEFLEKKSDKEYKLELDKKNNLNYNNFLKETKIILSIIYERFFATIEEKQAKYIKIENNKKEKYNVDIFKNKTNNNYVESEDIDQERSLIEYKENIWQKIKKFCYKLVHRTK